MISAAPSETQPARSQLQVHISSPPRADAPQLVTMTFSPPPSWENLAARIQVAFNIPLESVAVYYIDGDGDEITLNSETELQELYNITLAQLAAGKDQLGVDPVLKLLVRDLRTLGRADATQENDNASARTINLDDRNPEDVAYFDLFPHRGHGHGGRGGHRVHFFAPNSPPPGFPPHHFPHHHGHHMPMHPPVGPDAANPGDFPFFHRGRGGRGRHYGPPGFLPFDFNGELLPFPPFPPFEDRRFGRGRGWHGRYGHRTSYESSSDSGSGSDEDRNNNNGAEGEANNRESAPQPGPDDRRRHYHGRHFHGHHMHPGAFQPPFHGAHFGRHPMPEGFDFPDRGHHHGHGAHFGGERPHGRHHDGHRRPHDYRRGKDERDGSAPAETQLRGTPFNGMRERKLAHRLHYRHLHHHLARPHHFYAAARHAGHHRRQEEGTADADARPAPAEEQVAHENVDAPERERERESEREVDDAVDETRSETSELVQAFEIL